MPVHVAEGSPHLDVAQHLGRSAYQHIVSNLRVAVTSLFARATQRHVLLCGRGGRSVKCVWSRAEV
jgi:hypothetical protein